MMIALLMMDKGTAYIKALMKEASAKNKEMSIAIKKDDPTSASKATENDFRIIPIFSFFSSRSSAASNTMRIKPILPRIFNWFIK